MCFCRVAVLMAVMIWRVTHSSAKARKEVSLSGLKSRMALNSPIMPSCTMSSWSAPIRKYDRALERTKFLYFIISSSSAASSPSRASSAMSSSVMPS